MKKSIVAVSLVVACGFSYAQDDVEQRIDSLQKELDALKSEVKSDTSGTADAADTGNKTDAEEEVTEASLEEYQTPAAMAGEGRAVLSGYGEINYNNYKDSTKRDEFDLQRFVLFVGYRFNERTRLYSEIEVEHGFVEGGEESGEVAMEQAFIEYALTQSGSADVRAGLMLMPIGIINEYHESPTYYGVERNQVETLIIPTTWREIGFALRGNIANGLEYNAGFSTTPDASLFTNASSGFRSMRAKASKVTANDFGYFVGLNYRGIPGFLLGGGVYTGNTAQNGQGKGPNAVALTGADANLTIWDLRTEYSAAGWDLRALYTQGSLGDTAAINAAAGMPLGSDRAAPESFSGWYAEVAYHVYRRGDFDVAPFVRYSEYNTQESVAPGYTINPLNDEEVVTVGVNFYVHPQVVFKFDVQDFSTDDKKDRFDVGIGWMF